MTDKVTDVNETGKPEGPTSCRECSGKNISWFASNTITAGIQQGRLNTSDVSCVFVLGCDDCSETLAVVRADTIADKMNRAIFVPVTVQSDMLEALKAIRETYAQSKGQRLPVIAQIDDIAVAAIAKALGQ